MPLCNSPIAIPDLSALSGLAEFVFDKRQGQRATANKHRRNRHYEKQFIRNTLAHLRRIDCAAADEQGRLALTQDSPLGQEDESRTRCNAPQ